MSPSVYVTVAVVPSAVMLSMPRPPGSPGWEAPGSSTSVVVPSVRWNTSALASASYVMSSMPTPSSPWMITGEVGT